LLKRLLPASVFDAKLAKVFGLDKLSTDISAETLDAG
jgi:hypothetical protein